MTSEMTCYVSSGTLNLLTHIHSPVIGQPLTYRYSLLYPSLADKVV